MTADQLIDRLLRGGEGGFGRPWQAQFVATAGDVRIAAANPRRRAIAIANNDPGSTVFVTINAAGAPTKGYALPPQDPGLVLWDHDVGRLVQAEFHASALLVGAPAGPQVPFGKFGAQDSTAAAGTLQSLNVPAGNAAVVTGATLTNIQGGPPTVALQWIHGASTITLNSGTVAALWNTPLNLGAADTIRWQCTAGVAASTVDDTISGYSYVPGTGAGAGANVTVWELEG